MNDTDKPIIHKNTNLRLSWFKARDKIKCFVITMHLIHSIKMLTQFSLKKKISFKINLFFFYEISIQTRNLYSLSSRRGFMIIEKISEIACCITNDYSARITWAVEMDPAQPY